MPRRGDAARSAGTRIIGIRFGWFGFAVGQDDVNVIRITLGQRRCRLPPDSRATSSASVIWLTKSARLISPLTTLCSVAVRSAGDCPCAGAFSTGWHNSRLAWLTARRCPVVNRAIASASLTASPMVLAWEVWLLSRRASKCYPIGAGLAIGICRIECQPVRQAFEHNRLAAIHNSPGRRRLGCCAMNCQRG